MGVSSDISFAETSDMILSCMDRWDITASRGISYRTFKPLIRLLGFEKCRVAQVYAVWAMANFTSAPRHASKYCKFVVEEGALEILEGFLTRFENNSDGPSLESDQNSSVERLISLSKIVISNVQKWRSGHLTSEH